MSVSATLLTLIVTGIALAQTGPDPDQGIGPIPSQDTALGPAPQDTAPRLDAESGLPVETIVVDVGGTMFSLSSESFRMFPQLWFNHLIKFNTAPYRYTIDRDADVFRYVVTYMRYGRLFWKPDSPVTLSQIIADAEFFALPGLADLAQDMINGSIEELPFYPTVYMRLSLEIIRYSNGGWNMTFGEKMFSWLGPFQPPSSAQYLTRDLYYDWYVMQAIDRKIDQLNAEERDKGACWRLIFYNPKYLILQKMRLAPRWI